MTEENGVLQRDAIALPLLRPVSKPPSVPPPSETPRNGNAHSEPLRDKLPAKTEASQEIAPPKPSSPPTVQSLKKLNLDILCVGDKVVVKTSNSTYNFEIHGPYLSKVIPSKSNARSGEVTLMGGLNTEGTEYTPNRAYVGGHIAYQFSDEESAILTSQIESIFWVAVRKPEHV